MSISQQRLPASTTTTSASARRNRFARGTQTAALVAGLFGGLALLSGCGAASTSFVKSDTTLGKIIIYRNGVAYFERNATVVGDKLTLAAPGDKVDDFLKSLTVIDAATGQPAPISYPTSNGGNLELKVNLSGPGPHKVKLTYVTDAPAWKPSYRITIPKTGKIALEAWAVVDNTSGEDWENVTLGVGSSSAMSFRFDLRGLRSVDRQTLRADDLFAMAPPSGGAAYGGRAEAALEFNDSTLAANDQLQQGYSKDADGNGDDGRHPPRDLRTGSAPRGSATRPTSKTAPPAVQAGPAQHWSGTGNGAGVGGAYRPDMPAPTVVPPAPPPNYALRNTAAQLNRSSNTIVVEGYAQESDADKSGASLERANKLREQLIREGVAANRIVAEGKGLAQGRGAGARIVEQQPAAADKKAGNTGAMTAPAEAGSPIGTSHFESKSAMTVPKNSSAMVAVYKGDTQGEVVYFYDAESARGNATFPFRAVRFANPTDSQLEQGPVTVFGDGRFIGEGMSEAIPAHSNAFVPFALDRQIVVETKDNERDEVARIMTVQRGIFSTELLHTKRVTYSLHNRSGEKAVVYIKHTVPFGYKLGKSVTVAEKLGNASLLRVEIAPNAKTDFELEESTPLFRSTDMRTPGGLDLMKAYVSSGALDANPRLREQVQELVKLQVEMANFEQRIATLREQNAEYRTRMDELHVQIVSLRAVKTASPIMANLERKLGEVSDRVSRATVDIVEAQEKLMVARIKFQDGVAELSLEPKAAAPAPTTPTATKPVAAAKK
jgi:hypothetical protein